MAYGRTGQWHHRQLLFLDERSGREAYMETADLLLAPTLFERAKRRADVKSALLSSKLKKTTTLLSSGYRSDSHCGGAFGGLGPALRSGYSASIAGNPTIEGLEGGDRSAQESLGSGAACISIPRTTRCIPGLPNPGGVEGAPGAALINCLEKWPTRAPRRGFPCRLRIMA